MTALGLITVLVSFVGKRDKLAFGRGPAELTDDFVGIFTSNIFHAAFFMAEFTIVSLKSASVKIVIAKANEISIDL